MTKLVYEIIDLVRKQKTKKEKVDILKANESWALKDILRGTYDPRVQWNIPEGQPPFRPSREESVPGNLLRENTKFRYFVKGGEGDKLPKVKREAMFLGLLEGIHPKDAELVIAMINKTAINGIAKSIVKEAFPGLLPS
jgi:hypothetical protein